MASSGCNYHQALSDGVDSPQVASRCRFKVGVALIGASGLLLLTVVATASTLTAHSPSTAESTSLFALPTSMSGQMRQNFPPSVGARFPSNLGANSGSAGRMGSSAQRPSTAVAPVGAFRGSGPLVGGSPSLKVSSAPVPGFTMDSLGNGPLVKLAVSAIEANDAYNRGDQKRAVAMRAQMKNVMARSEAEVKEELKATSAFKESLAGITAPFGFFDPAGLTSEISVGRLLFYREVEIKHGRLGMLASLGIVVGESFHPLFGGNIDVPAYQAFQQTPLQTFWPLVIFLMSIPEVNSVQTFENPFGEYLQKYWQVKGDRVPGDLGFDPLGLKPKDPKEFLELQNKELNNGRLAMLAAAGMLAQELVTGQKIF